MGAGGGGGGGGGGERASEINQPKDQQDKAVKPLALNGWVLHSRKQE